MRDYDGNSYTIKSWFYNYPDYKSVVVTKNENGATMLYFVRTDLTASGSTVSGGSASIFSLFGDYWGLSGSTAGVSAPASNVVWSAFDIKDSSGNVVIAGSNFPIPPLAEQVQEVTGAAMLEEAMEVTRTMGLLTVSGIGLMALLIGLALFGKRSLISLR